MNSPVSPLATVLAPVRDALEARAARAAYDAGLGASEYEAFLTKQEREALAVLDSLDGTITLSREEAEQIKAALFREAVFPAEPETRAALNLLATRIEESK